MGEAVAAKDAQLWACHPSGKTPSLEDEIAVSAVAAMKNEGSEDEQLLLEVEEEAIQTKVWLVVAFRSSDSSRDLRLRRRHSF